MGCKIHNDSFYIQIFQVIVALYLIYIDNSTFQILSYASNLHYITPIDELAFSYYSIKLKKGGYMERQIIIIVLPDGTKLTITIELRG